MISILVENLIKQYRNGIQALNGISLVVQAGEVFSLLGQNGAGKSTLINILTTYLRPTFGNIQIFEKDICKDITSIRSQIACVAQRISLDTYLSLEENMMFQSSLYKIPKSEAKKHMENLIDCFGLKQYLKYPVASYSDGIKRRLDIAMNMMSNPKILFLDEPTVGMDVQSRQSMWNMIKTICEDFGTTIFLTTHYLEEADSLSDNICIIKDGKEVAQGTPNLLRKYLHQDILKISFLDSESANQNLKQISEIFKNRKIELKQEFIFIPVVSNQKDLLQAVKFLLNQQIGFLGIEIVQPTIEDIFIYLTGDKEVCV